MAFNEQLKKIRISKNITQAQIASEIGVSGTQYQRYEYGTSEPTASKLIAIADYLCVSVDYLLGREQKEAEE